MAMSFRALAFRRINSSGQGFCLRAQRYRLGINYNQIPVNPGRSIITGFTIITGTELMRVDGNYGSEPAYSPNSMGDWSSQPGVMEPPLDLSRLWPMIEG